MKHYIILSPGIWDMGGSQMYTRNKLKYLRETLHNVNLFHAGVEGGKIMIDDLLEYENNRIIYLNYPAYLFKKRTQEKIISLICNQIPKQFKELFIESHSTASATWGELIAKRINAKHIIYLLSENNSIRNKSVYKFFRFKLERRELVGIQKKSIPILFRGRQSIDENMSYELSANCMNVIEDIKYPMLSQIPKSDYTIASIGRVNKLFLINILDDIIQFINDNQGSSFTFLFIGGEPSNSNSIKKIKEKFKNLSNVTLFFTGYIYPIPQELILTSNVFVSSSGSCYVSNSLGIPTIPIDSNDHKPIGVLDRTTKNVIYRDNEPQVELKKLLNDILIKRIYKPEVVVNRDEFKVDFSEHLMFISDSNNINSYFNINSISYSLIDWIERLSLFVLGDNLYRTVSMKFWPLWHKIKNHIKIN